MSKKGFVAKAEGKEERELVRTLNLKMFEDTDRSKRAPINPPHS